MRLIAIGVVTGARTGQLAEHDIHVQILQSAGRRRSTDRTERQPGRSLAVPRAVNVPSRAHDKPKHPNGACRHGGGEESKRTPSVAV
jgi:hypothetical protein